MFCICPIKELDETLYVLRFGTFGLTLRWGKTRKQLKRHTDLMDWIVPYRESQRHKINCKNCNDTGTIYKCHNDFGCIPMICNYCPVNRLSKMNHDTNQQGR